MIQTKKASLTAVLLGAALALPAAGQDVIGFDDFDGGGDSLTRVFSVDNTPNNGAFVTPTGFFGPFFDRFGIMDQSIGVGGTASEASVPFDFLDATLTGVPDDRLGIFESTDIDNFVGIADLENGNNLSGTGSVTWTYDISGYENINVAMDWAAVGNFTADDNFQLSASIDGGPAELIMDGAGSPGTSYTVTMEDGTEHNSFENIFFDLGTWTILTSGGPFGTITYSDDDVDQDGFLDGVTDLQTGAPIRVYQETDPNNFPGDDAEFNLFDSQFVVNGVGLDDEISTIAADVTGTGSTLTLTLDIAQNGSFQFLAFDDLEITGDLIAVGLLGDYNGNGEVDAADYTIWADNFNSTTNLAADGNDDGVVDAADYTIWADNFGNTIALSSGAFPVPEPSAGLILAGLGLMAARRRRQA
ncbi:MAG: PEP-CTERM sorting domain-containing protein [Planctomycetota bacterium]